MESQEFGGRLLQRSKKKDPQKHAAMLHAARQNIIAVQGAWAMWVIIFGSKIEVKNEPS